MQQVNPVNPAPQGPNCGSRASDGPDGACATRHEIQTTNEHGAKRRMAAGVQRTSLL